MNQGTKYHVHEPEANPCGCPEEPPKPVTCCNLVCFERPNYFCGHLLTDRDLALEQRYTIEKNKLRNRTLHGYGVVCGLGLSCDPECSGYIRIATGYAIDDCGNDLIVCEPRRFNVLQALRDKHWLLGDSKHEPCGPGEEEPECEPKQCFYITACYTEEYAKYTTPFEAGCHSGPQQCLPTRVTEGVRFDVLDTMPTRPSYISQLKARIEKCFKAFTDGAIGRTIKKDESLKLIEEALSGNAHPGSSENKDPYCELFCLLRAQFLQHLKQHPDQHNCTLYKEVKDLVCPARDRESYGRELKEAYCKLIELMLRFLYDCVIAATLIACPEPCEASCIVLGTVEVEGGEIVKVCNSPRWYVWSFANLLPLLYHFILTKASQSRPPVPQTPSAPPTSHPPVGVPTGGVPPNEPAPREPEEGCCPEYDLGLRACEGFIREFRVSENARKYAALSPLLATEAFLEALLQSLDFTSPDAVSPALLRSASLEQLNHVAENLGVSVQAVPEAQFISPADPIHAFFSNTLIYRGSSVMAAQPFEGAPFTVSSHITGAPAAVTKPEVEDRFNAFEQRIATLQNELNEAKSQIDALRNPPQPSA